MSAAPTTPRAYLHSCGGWYAACEDAAGYHHAPHFCVVAGAGRCHDTPAAALAATANEEEEEEAAL